MAQDLKQYLAEHPCKGFKPVPHYFPEGDYVTYFHRDERARAQRLDDLLTVYLSLASGELVGCKIKGVRHLLQTAGSFGVTVQDGHIKLGFFFLIGSCIAREEAQKKLYQELNRMAQDVELTLPLAG